MTPTEKAVVTRSDGLESRARLLQAALRLFAEKGFAKTSTREIALAAQANIAAISYYFGDKAGLYRAVLTDPTGGPDADAAVFEQPGLSLQQALQGCWPALPNPSSRANWRSTACACTSGKCWSPPACGTRRSTPRSSPRTKPCCACCAATWACRGPTTTCSAWPSPSSGLGVHLFVGHDVMQAIAPGLAGTPQAVDRYTDRLVDYALAMVHGEAQRRQAA